MKSFLPWMKTKPKPEEPQILPQITDLQLAEPEDKLDPIYEFKCGIKHNPAGLNTLENDQQWETWHCHTIATTRAQDVDDVLDDSCVPFTPEDKALFEEKQKYMYSVLVTYILTDKGKVLLH